jgi:hypothetical protein
MLFLPEITISLAAAPQHAKADAAEPVCDETNSVQAIVFLGTKHHISHLNLRLHVGEVGNIGHNLRAII